MNQGVHFQSCTGQNILKYVPSLAQLRLKIFRAYPYLYNGNQESEENYLKTLAAAKKAILILAWHGQQIIGASTGMPMSEESPNIQAAWRAHGDDLDKVFYFSESVLEEAFRGQGIGLHFFKIREDWARSLNQYSELCFCGVLRPADHPARPKNYIPLDEFWKRRGFRLLEGYTCQISWRELGAAQETSQTLQFWHKYL